MQFLKLFPIIFSCLAVGHVAATSSSSSPKIQNKLQAIGDNSVLHGLKPVWAPIYLGLGDAYREQAENLIGHAQAEREGVKRKMQRQAVMCYLHALSLDNINTLWQAKSRLLDCCIGGIGMKTNFTKALELAAELSKQNEDSYLNGFGMLRAGQMLILGQGCSLTPSTFEKGWSVLQDLEKKLKEKTFKGFPSQVKVEGIIDANLLFARSSEIELLANAFRINISRLLGDKDPIWPGGLWVYNQPKSDDLIALEKCRKIFDKVDDLAGEHQDNAGSDEYFIKLGRLCMKGIDLLRMKMSSTTSWLCKGVLLQALNRGYKPAISNLPSDPQQPLEKRRLIVIYGPWRRQIQHELAEQRCVPLASYPALSSGLREHFNAEPMPPVRLPDAQRTIVNATNMISEAQVPSFIRRRLAIEWLEQFLKDRTFLRSNANVQAAAECLRGIIQIIQQDDLRVIQGIMGQYGKVYGKILLSAALFDERMGLVFRDHRQGAIAILDGLLGSTALSKFEEEIEEEGWPYNPAFTAYEECTSLEDIQKFIEKYVPTLRGNEAFQSAETLTALITIVRDFYQVNNQRGQEG